MYGLDSEDNDEERIEAELPEYLKERRAQFNYEHERLEEAGLKLPPSYDDIQFSDDAYTSALSERPVFHDLRPCADYLDIELPLSGGIIPAPLAQWLREYQVKGVTFLHELFVYQKGGILGDDMGLGKTIQVIAFLTAAFGKTGDERDAKRMRKMRRASGRPYYPKCLIVCPGTLMENWKNELTKWGWWQIYTYHGDTKAKEDALLAAKTGRLEILITTYSTYRLNRGELNLVDWDAVIADEFHIIKEPDSEITNAMAEVNALCRIGVTGTAIQNNYENLWTLLNWTNPGRFGPLRAWKTAISEPLKLGQSHDATVPQLAKARSTARKLVNNLLPQFFLRRMKTLIADQLPKKSDCVVFCPLTPSQQDAYENFLASEKVKAIRSSTDPCACGSDKKSGWCCNQTLSDGTRWQSHVFPSIACLQRLCSHLASLIPTSNEPIDMQTKALDNLQAACPDSWRQLYATRDSITNFANTDFCGKWRVLKKLLAFWHVQGDKVLVFSHSTRLLRMLQTLFSTKTSYTVSYLDGSMSYMERSRTVDQFNASPSQFVFLISTRAGGVGLNITSANKVVVVDPNWNPAHDLQAQDRAYRIGQTRDVEVFRLVSAGTIEEIVYARQIYKQQQANIAYNASAERRYFKGVMDVKEQKGEIFGLDNLFSFHGEEGNVVLREIVNATNVAESRAGVRVAGLDMDSLVETDDSQEESFDRGKKRRVNEHWGDDEAMSQLADLIAAGDSAKDDARTRTASDRRDGGENGKEKAKANPITAILASAGVGYTHENSEVIGSSRIEARLGRRAEEAAAYTGSGSHPEAVREKVFVGRPGSAGSLNSLDPRLTKRKRSSESSNIVNARKKFRPPQEVQIRQFCNMARALGFEDANGEVDVTGFALCVEGWTQNKRRAILERFYDLQVESLEQMGSVGMEKSREEDESSCAGNTKMEVETDSSVKSEAYDDDEL